MLCPVLDIDAEIPLEIINLALLSEIEKLKPFGLGNEEPLFVSRNAMVSDISFVGKEQQHAVIKFYAPQGENHVLKSILFGGAENELVRNLKLGDKLDLVYALKKNEFNGTTSVELIIKDLKK
jgi:single-stranded-DNA-specific exonuclease